MATQAYVFSLADVRDLSRNLNANLSRDNGGGFRTRSAAGSMRLPAPTTSTIGARRLWRPLSRPRSVVAMG